MFMVSFNQHLISEVASNFRDLPARVQQQRFQGYIKRRSDRNTPVAT